MIFVNALAFLGALGGSVIAFLVPDETGWYKRYFLLAAIVFFVAAALTFRISSFSLLFALLLSLLFSLAVYYKKSFIAALSAAALSFSYDVLTGQLLLVSLIPTAGYLYSHGVRKGLLWFLLMPIVLIAWFFLI